VIPKRTYVALKELNVVRNDCVHNWILSSYKIKEIAKKRRARKYTVTFKGKNLLMPKVMTEEFMPLYGRIYLKLWQAYYL
jgi:hypothetical protein